jgi:hypothetical protein
VNWHKESFLLLLWEYNHGLAGRHIQVTPFYTLIAALHVGVVLAWVVCSYSVPFVLFFFPRFVCRCVILWWAPLIFIGAGVDYRRIGCVLLLPAHLI